MLTSRAIALQGAGFGRLYVALQGLVQVAIPVAPETGMNYGSGSSATINASAFRARHVLAPVKPRRRARDLRERDLIFISLY